MNKHRHNDEMRSIGEYRRRYYPRRRDPCQTGAALAQRILEDVWREFFGNKPYPVPKCG